MAFAVGHISGCYLIPAVSIGQWAGGRFLSKESVNPARSTAVALFAGGWAVQQLWFFWIAPIIGGVLEGLVHRWLGENDQ